MDFENGLFGLSPGSISLWLERWYFRNYLQDQRPILIPESWVLRHDWIKRELYLVSSQTLPVDLCRRDVGGKITRVQGPESPDAKSRVSKWLSARHPAPAFIRKATFATGRTRGVLW